MNDAIMKRARKDLLGDVLGDEGCDRGSLAAARAAMIAACREAWLAGVMTGFNGNMSLRVGPRAMLITASGVDKGHMGEGDIALADAATGRLLRGPRLSSETAMHVAVYRACPAARCVLHTHPEALMALWLRVGRERMLDLPLFEARFWRPRMGFAEEIEPGTPALAASVGEAAREHPAVFMPGHGLCVRGADPGETLGLTEQMEHLARTQLLVLGPG